MYNSPLFPKVLVRRDAGRLLRELKKEGLIFDELIASISGESEGDLSVWVWGYCYEEDERLEFEATWEFDWDKVSSPTHQYRFVNLEIFE